MKSRLRIPQIFKKLFFEGKYQHIKDFYDRLIKKIVKKI
jgi:hypothetical protein